MKHKTKLLVDRLVGTISSWPTIECISLNEAATPNTLDPYFALILDVYYRDKVPDAASRQAAYGQDVLAFETSSHTNKDRFLIGDFPVRIEYKDIKKVDELVTIADSQLEHLWLIKDMGTYGFYRLAHGDILYQNSSWIQDIRSRLKHLSSEFWNQMRDAHQSKMEHFLSDLGAALIQGDNFHYLISSAGFIKNACEVLFCINHRFEPSHRGFYEQVIKLPVLPDEFAGRFESFLANDSEMTAERKYSLAQLIARSIIAL
ncbi:MAG: DUF4037 domain-containing protein [Treponema sp.]|nr:DUF4037 domain-containing protein [Treponema sp.]